MTDSNTDEANDDRQPDPTRSKVGRIIEKYDLSDMGEELEARWTGEGGERSSLRDLASDLNGLILKTAANEAGMTPLDSVVQNWYEGLTDDDVSRGVETQVRKHLDRHGVDVEEVLGDFVTHQAVHTYLTKYRGAELQSMSRSESLSKNLETIQRLKNRTQAVTQNSLDRLKQVDHLETGKLQVIVDINVTCSECGRHYDVSTLLDEGRCECGGDLE
jgi:predicted transcriptional regulator